MYKLTQLLFLLYTDDNVCFRGITLNNGNNFHIRYSRRGRYRRLIGKPRRGFERLLIGLLLIQHVPRELSPKLSMWEIANCSYLSRLASDYI